jgi:hypothetical protein
VRLKGLWIGRDGAAVKGCGIVKAVLGIGDVTGVEEGARIGGMGDEIGIKF